MRKKGEMLPMAQTKTGRGGNCLQAAVASLFEFDLLDVPDFCNEDDEAENWFLRMNKWLIENTGYYCMLVTIEMWWIRKYLNCNWIAGVRRRETEMRHVIVMNGDQMVHDPAGREYSEYILEEAWIVTMKTGYIQKEGLIFKPTPIQPSENGWMNTWMLAGMDEEIFTVIDRRRGFE